MSNAPVRRYRIVFCRYSLRTTDPVAARAFYESAIGLVLPEGASETSILESWPLHERALARGAPPHWLGHIAVDDVEAAVNRLVGLGAERLGPTVNSKDGTSFATLRDPFGSVIAVRKRGESATDSPVVWHQLHSSDAEGAWGLYQELFGWSLETTIDVVQPIGGYRLFAWRTASATVGGMGNTARWPGVHPHWLYYFPVADIDRAAASVRASGGTAMDPFVLPSGMRLVACEDPQRAAFGLAQG